MWVFKEKSLFKIHVSWNTVCLSLIVISFKSLMMDNIMGKYIHVSIYNYFK